MRVPIQNLQKPQTGMGQEPISPENLLMAMSVMKGQGLSGQQSETSPVDKPHPKPRKA